MYSTSTTCPMACAYQVSKPQTVTAMPCGVAVQCTMISSMRLIRIFAMDLFFQCVKLRVDVKSDAEDAAGIDEALGQDIENAVGDFTQGFDNEARHGEGQSGHQHANGCGILDGLFVQRSQCFHPWFSFSVALCCCMSPVVVAVLLAVWLRRTFL